MSIDVRVLAVSILLAILPAGAAHGQGKETPLAEGRRTLAVQGERFGTLADDHPATLQARGIFDRIVRAAGRRPGVAFELHVLDTPRVIAESLLGGFVVVSRGFVELAQSDPHALAFILGHEVAHLVRDHHGILDSLGVLGAGAASGRPPSPEHVRAYQYVELEADRLGVLFAGLAGYDVSAAVPTLLTLTARVGPDVFHPSPKERAARIREEITGIGEHLEVFYLGLYLLSAGRYLESARVLEHFLGLFPSREVLSAVGVAYHREALRWAPAAEFRHLLVVDSMTRAPSPRGGRRPPQFRVMMERAVQYYTLAADADPTYAPALSNLAAASLDLGEPDLALGYANRALRQDPRLVSAYVNRAIARAIDRDSRRAEEDFLAAARLAPFQREVAWNLGRLYEREGRGDEARRWAARAKPVEPGVAEPSLPAGFEERVREWIAEPGARSIRIPLGGRPPEDVTLVVSRGRGVAALVRQGVVDAVGILPSARAIALGGVRPGDAPARVEAAWGRPTALDGFQALSVWSYPRRPLAVFLLNERVHSIWAGFERTRGEDGLSRAPSARTP